MIVRTFVAGNGPPATVGPERLCVIIICHCKTMGTNQTNQTEGTAGTGKALTGRGRRGTTTARMAGGERLPAGEQALPELLAVFRQGRYAQAWYPGIDKDTYAAALEDRVRHPAHINQGQSGTCGAAVLCKLLAEFFPDKYVEMAISLYLYGRYDEWGLRVSAASLTGTDARARELGTTAVDLITQGAFVHSFNYLLGYNPFADGPGARSFMWPGRMRRFLTRTLHLQAECRRWAGMEDLRGIDFDGNFVVAAVHDHALTDGVHRFSRPLSGPNHYVQILGTEGPAGLRYWNWGSGGYHSAGAATFFIYVVRRVSAT